VLVVVGRTGGSGEGQRYLAWRRSYFWGGRGPESRGVFPRRIRSKGFGLGAVSLGTADGDDNDDALR